MNGIVLSYCFKEISDWKVQKLIIIGGIDSLSLKKSKNRCLGSNITHVISWLIFLAGNLYPDSWFLWFSQRWICFWIWKIISVFTRHSDFAACPFEYCFFHWNFADEKPLKKIIKVESFIFLVYFQSSLFECEQITDVRFPWKYSWNWTIIWNLPLGIHGP